MADKIKRGTSRIRFEGVFDWKELYGTIVGWFFDKKYDYYEKTNAKKSGTYGYKFEFEAHAEREESGYVRHDIDIHIVGYHMEDIDVLENGEKKHKTKAGMFIIEITPTLVVDYQDAWDKNVKKKMRDFFHKYIIKGYIYEQLDKVYYESYKLHTKIKEELGLETKYSAY